MKWLKSMMFITKWMRLNCAKIILKQNISLNQFWNIFQDHSTDYWTGWLPLMRFHLTSHSCNCCTCELQAKPRQIFLQKAEWIPLKTDLCYPSQSPHEQAPAKCGNEIEYSKWWSCQWQWKLDSLFDISIHDYADDEDLLYKIVEKYGKPSYLYCYNPDNVDVLKNNANGSFIYFTIYS